MESSVAIAIGAISEVVVWCSPDSGSGGVVTSIKVSSSLVAGSVSHVADSSSVSSSVTISVVVVRVVAGVVVRVGVVGGVAVIDVRGIKRVNAEGDVAGFELGEGEIRELQVGRVANPGDQSGDLASGEIA